MMRNGRWFTRWFIAIVLSTSLLIPVSSITNSQRAEAAAFDPQTGQENISLRTWNNEKLDNGFYINAAARFLLDTTKAPSYKTGSGEWVIMDVARGMYTGYDFINHIQPNYFTDYKKRVDEEVDQLKGELDAEKSTEYSRLILAMSALGYDVRKMGSKGQFNFIDKLSQSSTYASKQGINGPIWQLLALNTAGYELFENPSQFTSKNDINSAGKMIDTIMDKEIVQANGVVGGWALYGRKPDPDITGMAIQGIARYYTGKIPYPSDAKTSISELKKAIERAVVQLSAIQENTGGFGSWGTLNSESVTQVIVALTALNMDPKANTIHLPTIAKDVSFVKSGGVSDGVYTNNMIDNLYSFWQWGSGLSPEVAGFSHVTTGYDGGGGSGTGVNGMATYQALYGLIAYDRFLKGQNSLYDMSDQINGEYKSMTARKVDVIFHARGQEKTEKYAPYGVLTIPAISPNNDKVLSWDTMKDGSGISYFPNELLSIPEQSITLYAQFERQTYAIHYELDGGVIVANEYAKNYANNETTELPTAQQVTKTAYQFVGWYANKDFTGKVITTISKGESGDKIVYAKWIDTQSLVKEVITLINALPTTVVESNKTMIENISYLYGQLSATQKLQVTNYGKLVDAEQQLKGVLALNNLTVTDAEKSAGVVAYISVIPGVKDITLDSQSIINRARTAYDALTVKQKSNVFNYRLLIAAEKAFQLIESKEVDAIVAKRLITAINQLPLKVTVKSQAAIESVRIAYDTAKESQQILVTNYNKLVQREIALKVALNDAAINIEKIKNNMTIIIGTSTPRAILTAYVNNERIGRVIVANNGKYAIKIAKQKANVKIVIKATGVIKATKSIVVQPSKVLQTPKVNSVKVGQRKVTGKAVKNTIIYVYNAKNKRIGTGVVSRKGQFSVKIAKQKKGAVLTLQIMDSMNNVSKKKLVKVK